SFAEKNVANAEQRQFTRGAEPRYGVHRAVFGDVCRDQQFIEARLRCFGIQPRLEQLDFEARPRSDRETCGTRRLVTATVVLNPWNFLFVFVAVNGCIETAQARDLITSRMFVTKRSRLVLCHLSFDLGMDILVSGANRLFLLDIASASAAT